MPPRNFNDRNFDAHDSKDRHPDDRNSDDPNSKAGKTTPIPSNAGLCATCQHASRIESDRGSVFIRCELALTDPSFAKYPRLPVLTCSGHKPRKF